MSRWVVRHSRRRWRQRTCSSPRRRARVTSQEKYFPLWEAKPQRREMVRQHSGVTKSLPASHSKREKGDNTSMPSASSRTTTDHDEIRQWAEERGGRPSCVRNTGGDGDIGILRIDFPGYSGEGSLEEISWDDWFDKFDERRLALLFQETTAGGQRSNFNKLVSRQTAKQSQTAHRGTARQAAATSKSRTASSSARSSSRSGKSTRSRNQN